MFQLYRSDVCFFSICFQRTNTCCRQTGSQVRSQRALWVNRWSTWQITAWKERGWSSTRSRRSPPFITSNTTTTSTFMSTTWWRPPKNCVPVSAGAHGFRSLSSVVTCSSVKDGSFFFCSRRRNVQLQNPKTFLLLCLLALLLLYNIAYFKKKKRLLLLIFKFNLIYYLHIFQCK